MEGADQAGLDKGGEAPSVPVWATGGQQPVTEMGVGGVARGVRYSGPVRG